MGVVSPGSGRRRRQAGAVPVPPAQHLVDGRGGVVGGREYAGRWPEPRDRGD